MGELACQGSVNGPRRPYKCLVSNLSQEKTPRTRMAWRLVVATMLVLALDAALLPFPSAAATTASAESWKSTTAAWGGTLNGANSAYAQGLTIPSRLVITGETLGVHALDISYDFQDSTVGSNLHFIDFIENYDRTIPRSIADPCAGVTGCSGSPTTIGIPSDVTISSQRAGMVSVWNASNLSLGVYTTSASGGALTKHITLLYTATAGANVVVAFGAHIASPTDWGTGNGASSWAGGSGKVGGTHDGGTEKIVGINPGAFGVATNTAPNVSGTSVALNQNSSTSVTLSASDAEDCELSFTIVSPPTHGTLSAITNSTCTGTTGAYADTASVTYTPTAGYSGSDSFTWTANDGTIDGATATVSVTVNAVGSTPQTITFTQPTSPAAYGATFTVSPTSTSGLPVSVAASGGCTISGSTVTMTSGTTDCTLVASQSGDGTYAPAPNVTRTVSAAKASQTITLAQPTTPATYGTSFSVSATSSSGLAVTIGASGGCTISGSTVTMTSGTIDCVLMRHKRATPITPEHRRDQRARLGFIRHDAFADRDRELGSDRDLHRLGRVLRRPRHNERDRHVHDHGVAIGRCELQRGARRLDRCHGHARPSHRDRRRSDPPVRRRRADVHRDGLRLRERRDPGHVGREWLSELLDDGHVRVGSRRLRDLVHAGHAQRYEL